jgi:stage IV sporulation protein FB
VSLGRVSDIEIRIHASFLLLVVLFVLAGTAPEGPGVPKALAWLVLIFACVVVHELAHCFVARGRGGVVHEILLLPIGGVSKLERLPEGPRDELAMAIAGPAASLGLAVLAGILTVLAGESLLPVEILGSSLLASLFWFNLLVAGFNLLPAFPLDGGRVLRALLERAYDLPRATHLAATAGRAVAIAMIVGGFFFFDLWLTIIGVFVYFGASAEEAATLAHWRLAGHQVGDAMLHEPVTIAPEASIAELHGLSRGSAQRAFPIFGPAGYEGILDASAIEHAVAGATAVGLADREAPPIASRDDLEERLPTLLSTPARALAVVDGPRVVGVLRAEDVQHLVDEGAFSGFHDPEHGPRPRPRR